VSDPVLNTAANTTLTQSDIPAVRVASPESYPIAVFTGSSTGLEISASLLAGSAGRVTPPYELRELIRQLDDVGSKSLPLVALAGAAIGTVLSMEVRSSMTDSGTSMLPSAVVYSVIQEMGPIITGWW